MTDTTTPKTRMITLTDRPPVKRQWRAAAQACIANLPAEAL